MKKRLLLPLLLLLLALALSACGKQSAPVEVPDMTDLAPAQVVAEGRVTPARDTWLNFAARGPVTEILVAEGEAVRAGDVIARLGDREGAEAALAAAQAELQAAQQAYDAFLRNADQAKAQAWQAYTQAQAARAQAEAAWNALDEEALQDDIDAALADVRAREQDLQDAQDEFDKYKDLDRNNPSRQAAKDALDQAQQDYDDAVHAWEAAQRALDEPRAALDAALAAEAEAKRLYDDIVANGYDSEQKALLEARLEAAKAQVAAAERTLAQYDLVAPFDGVITDINLTVGQLAGPETLAARIADFSQWYVETTDLTELEVVNVTVGQAVEIVPDALQDLTLIGTVTDIAQSYTLRGGDVLYKVTIRLDTTDPALRWGMTVEVRFQQ